jgi:hypothetical protein
MGEVTTIGLDLAKHVFHVHGVDAEGATVLRKQLRRAQVLAFFSRLPPCLVGLEACATRTEQFPAVAAELVKAQVDVILAGSEVGRGATSIMSAVPPIPAVNSMRCCPIGARVAGQ